ncbi:MAG: DNA polymerase ligase N-terminal domain-containing protein [Acidimicrobiia bacterium]
MAEEDLDEYRDKRHFDQTPEPAGRADNGNGSRFVIQKHDASRLHYDFRLEAGGVLKSWAVPKGPSTDPREKRLAVPTEDHPLEYIDFEGVIPDRQYGAGTVMVWDTGEYENLTSDDDGEEIPVPEAIEGGHVSFRLHGKKLQGGYALTRAGEERWLLVKMDDDQADARRNPTSTQPDSVLTGRSLDRIAEDQ